MQSVGLFVALPLGSGSQPIAVAAVALASGSSAALAPENVAEQLRWGAGWLEALPWARRSKDVRPPCARAASCLDLLAAVGEQPRLQGMTIAIANDLAARLRCDRVSVGLSRRNGSVRLSAISHSASFKNQGRLVDAIENAMEEAIDQRSSVAYPPLPSTERAVTMAHRALAEVIRAPGAALMSVVLADSKGGAGRRHHLRASPRWILRQGDVAAGRGHRRPAWAHRRAADAGEPAARRPHRRFGRRRPHGAAGASASGAEIGRASASSLSFWLWRSQKASTVLPQDRWWKRRCRGRPSPRSKGSFASAPVRAGDIVKSGDLLAALDDRDLLLDRSKWRAERDKLLQKQRDALANHNRTDLVVLDSQIRQAESQLALAEDNLARARIMAPFDGMVVAGDLSQMLGSPVEKGKTLFEIAPLDAYRLIVHVDERDMRYIAAGQKGSVALAGMPWNPLPFVLTKITPVTVAEEGRNSFSVEARLTEHGPRLRPGMEGVAKIETGQRPVLWIWTHASSNGCD